MLFLVFMLDFGLWFDVFELGWMGLMIGLEVGNFVFCCILFLNVIMLGKFGGGEGW